METSIEAEIRTVINQENLATIIKHLVFLRKSKKDHKFNMLYWITHPDLNRSFYSLNKLTQAFEEKGINEPISPYECKTAACLAGHVALINKIPPQEDIPCFAMKWLNLDERQANYLFSADWSATPLSLITLTQAINYLRKLQTPPA